MNMTTIKIKGLGRLDALELQSLLGGNAKTTEAEQLSAQRQGSAAMIDLVAPYTPVLIGILGLWLLKPREASTEITMRKTGDDGKESSATYKHSHRSESPAASVVAFLARFFGVTSSIVSTSIDEARSHEN